MLNNLRLVAAALLLFLAPLSLSGCSQARTSDNPSAAVQQAPPPGFEDEPTENEKEIHPVLTVLYGIVGILGTIAVAIIMMGGM